MGGGRVSWSLIVEARTEATLFKLLDRVLDACALTPCDLWARPWRGDRPARELRFWTEAPAVVTSVAAAGAVLEPASRLFSLWTVDLKPTSGIICQGWTPPEAGEGRVKGLVHGSFVVESGDVSVPVQRSSADVRQRVVHGTIVNLADGEQAD
jgi:hypothetical protein